MTLRGQNFKKYTKEQVETAMGRYNAGWSIPVIADVMKIPLGTLRSWKRIGWQPTYIYGRRETMKNDKDNGKKKLRYMTEQEKTTIELLFGEGHEVKRIAMLLDRPYGTVMSHLVLKKMITPTPRVKHHPAPAQPEVQETQATMLPDDIVPDADTVIAVLQYLLDWYKTYVKLGNR